jgi:hypothetical protein
MCAAETGNNTDDEQHLERTMQSKREPGAGLQDALGAYYSAVEREGGVDVTREAPSSLRFTCLKASPPSCAINPLIAT